MIPDWDYAPLHFWRKHSCPLQSQVGLQNEAAEGGLRREMIEWLTVTRAAGMMLIQAKVQARGNKPPSGEEQGLGFFEASQTEPGMDGARGKGLTVRDRKPKEQGRESRRERGGEVWRKCTSPDKSIGIYSTVTAGDQAAVPERDQGPTQAGRGNESDGNGNEKRPNANKTREDQSGIACRGNFMSGLKWTRRRGRLSNADWSSSHLFLSLFWKLFELQSFKPSGYL